MFDLSGPQPGLLGAQTGITDRVAPQQRDFERTAISAYLARNEASAQGSATSQVIVKRSP
jgi:hypothetical protein